MKGIQGSMEADEFMTGEILFYDDCIYTLKNSFLECVIHSIYYCWMIFINLVNQLAGNPSSVKTEDSYCIYISQRFECDIETRCRNSRGSVTICLQRIYNVKISKENNPYLSRFSNLSNTYCNNRINVIQRLKKKEPKLILCDETEARINKVLQFYIYIQFLYGIYRFTNFTSRVKVIRQTFIIIERHALVHQG